MRCFACNKKLTDYECSLKSVETQDYLDGCVKCLQGLSIVVAGNSSLIIGQEVDMDDVVEFDDTPWILDDSHLHDLKEDD